jgi:6-phosphogluconolactonase (cycloisomerase 2 family)
MLFPNSVLRARQQGLRQSGYFTLPMLLLCVLCGFSMMRGTASAQQSFVYLESNIGKPVNGNSIFGFRNDGSGRLTPIQGSPFRLGGSGVFDPSDVLMPTDADQQLVTDPLQQFMFAVNGGSNTVAVFTIGNNGALTAVRNSPFPSQGPNPSSLGYDPNLNIMTVVNRNTDPNQPVRRNAPNYATFTVSSSGALVPTGNTVNLTLNAMPSQALVQPANNLVFTLEYETANITSYRLGATGTMTKVSQLGPPASGMNPLGEARHPTQNVVYVGYPTSSLVGVYTFDNSGRLTFVQTVAAGAGDCWMTVNAAGTRLYVADSGIFSISVYDITNATSPVLIQTLALSQGPRVYNVALDQNGQFLYALGVRKLYTLQVLSDGTLQESRFSPTQVNMPQTAGPVGVVTVSK